MNNQIENLTETDVKLLMDSLLQDLGKLGGAKQHSKVGRMERRENWLTRRGISMTVSCSTRHMRGI